MDQSLAGRSVVITGGGGSLGAAVADAMLARGAECHITTTTKKQAERFKFKAGAIMHHLDAAAELSVAFMYSRLNNVWASIHTVGAFKMAPIEETTADNMKVMFETNTLTAFLCCREAIKAMRKTGNGGRIVNVAARPAIVPTPGMIAYATSKAAVGAMTQAMAEETRSENIFINAVLPSVMDTPANRSAMPNADFSKWPKVEEVAEAIAFLVDPANALVTGALVPVFGRA